MVYFHPTNNLKLFPRVLPLGAIRSWVGLEWALPGVVVGIVVPLSVSVGDALELLVSNVVVSIGVWSWSVDTLFTGNQVRWLVDSNGVGSE